LQVLQVVQQQAWASNHVKRLLVGVRFGAHAPLLPVTANHDFAAAV
jgi:hypothetical protein